MPHPLVATVEAAIDPPLRGLGDRFLPGLERRLAGLLAWPGDRTALAQNKGEQRAARRFLDSVEGSWDDGDEVLVRSFLDRWNPREDDGAGPVRAMLEAATALTHLQTRPQTLWFFLWEMQSICDGLVSRGVKR